ncbi:MAG: ABC transporter ATP-binding protein [Chloroflexota bacterium]|nr:MAG: dipeptide/oligopeptide/nickel ABC transporter ATP-binding protein [Chloroflexota bacterium]
MTTPVLRVQDLHVHYRTAAGPVKAVNGVSFDLAPGERLGLVGESGSGKTTMALALMRMLEQPARIEGGRVLLDGVDLLALSEEQMRRIRFDRLSMVPQGAMNSLNPVMRIRDQMIEIFNAHGRHPDKAERRERIGHLLERVGLKRDVADRYPHELSGGMKQRVCIAMAIALRPQVIIADEPTSALDVVVQRQVMETLGAVQKDLNAAVILVGHDMGLMAQFADRIGVMYAGRLVELAPVRQIFSAPQHPYTQMLIASIPSLEEKRLFKGIPGVAPSLLNPPSGCPFHPRCPAAFAPCPTINPALEETDAGRWVACHLHSEAVLHDSRA